ncbi:hypothetical protein FRC05_005225 [Tulasnella sp. 425]|nr:hypothetical protein FRC05_005225 [Tulasnella sp. 425]
MGPFYKAADQVCKRTAFLFALTLVEALAGPEKRKEVYGPMVFPSGYYTAPL